MHHHRLVLNGPPDQVEGLARALLAAGAEADPHADPPSLTWATPTPAPLPALCAEHPGAVVGVERFTLLGPTLERFVLRGAEATILERRPFAPVTDDDPSPIVDDATLAECEPLPGPLLHAAALQVAEQPLRFGPGPLVTALDDALLVGIAIGDLCTAALGAPPEDDTGSPAVLAALAALAAAALTAAAEATDPGTRAEFAHERAHHLTEAHALAVGERLWSRPGDADRSEWLMYTMLGATAVIEDCAVATYEPSPLLSLHAEHGTTREERLGHGTTRLVATILQALVLFAPAATPSETSGCARN